MTTVNLVWCALGMTSVCMMVLTSVLLGGSGLAMVSVKLSVGLMAASCRVTLVFTLCSGARKCSWILLGSRVWKSVCRVLVLCGLTGCIYILWLPGSMRCLCYMLRCLWAKCGMVAVPG